VARGCVGGPPGQVRWWGWIRMLRAVQPGDFGIGRLFWAIRDAAIVADAATGWVVLWNPAAERLFGYPAAEARGLPSPQARRRTSKMPLAWSDRNRAHCAPRPTAEPGDQCP
jgi:PAS domain-containing protein